MRTFSRKQEATASETPLLDQVEGWFVEHEWNYDRNDEGGYLVLGYGDEPRQWTFVADANEHNGLILMYSILPFPMPEDRLAAGIEAITRANWGLMMGNFELDLDDGQMRYKTSFTVEDADGFSADMWSAIFSTNLSTVERYWDALTAVAEGGNPATEIEQADNAG